jgi:hypothetical protein
VIVGPVAPKSPHSNSGSNSTVDEGPSRHDVGKMNAMYEREINGEHSCEIRLEFYLVSEEQDRFKVE